MVSGPAFSLNITALASDRGSENIPGFTPRKGTGKILGLNVLGVSSNAAEDASTPWGRTRVDFLFDEGEVTLKGPFGGRKIPYPVPFRLEALKDNFVGWIDTTYLGEGMRVGKGNKGTTFVLVRR